MFNIKKFIAVFILILFGVGQAFAATKIESANPDDLIIYYLKQDEVKKFYEEFFSKDYYKKFPEIVKENDPYYDPDLKLSIAELQKKYPLDWVEKKYGKIPNGYCEDGEFPGDASKYPNLICTFHSNYTKKSYKDRFEKNVSMKDFSESEIKSAFVGHVDLSKEIRSSDVITVTVLYFLNTEKGNLSESDKRLRNFVLSPKILLNALKNMKDWTVFQLTESRLLTDSSYYQDLAFLTMLQVTLGNYECGAKYFGGCKIAEHYSENYPVTIIFGNKNDLKVPDLNVRFMNYDHVYPAERLAIIKNFKVRFLMN